MIPHMTERIESNSHTMQIGAPSKIVMAMPADPWSEWTMSGISRQLCLEIKRRGVLMAALDPQNPNMRTLQGPSLWSSSIDIISRVIFQNNVKSGNPWINESEGVVGEYLRTCEKGTCAIYAFHNPNIDVTLELKRYRLMDISLLDAIRTESYGHLKINKENNERKYDREFKTIHSATGILTLSSYAADSISRDFRYPRSKIFPIGAGAAISISGHPDTNVSRYQRGEILFVGRDWQRKGGPLLLEAFSIVKKVLPHATLTIVGPDQNPAPGCEGVNFVGFLAKSKKADAERLKRIFARSSVFCMPSVCETWGLVYVEAAQAGMPIAGFHEWALPDIVLNGKTGVLADHRSASELANCLTSILANPTQAASMGREAIQYVRDVLSWENVAERLLFAVSQGSANHYNPKWLAGDLERQNLLSHA